MWSSMAVELSTSFLKHGWTAAILKCKHVNVRFYPLPSPRSLSASCKMRHRNSGSSRRQQSKKIYRVQLPKKASIQSTGSEESDSENSNMDILSNLIDETITNDTTDVNVAADSSEEKISSSLILLRDTKLLVHSND